MPDQNLSPTVGPGLPRRPGPLPELALSPRVRLGGELLFVPTVSARTSRRRALARTRTTAAAGRGPAA